MNQASINISTSGDNTVITGVSGQVIKVYKLFLVVNAAVNLIFKNGASTNLTGTMNMLANGSVTLDNNHVNDPPWFVMSSGNGFVINLSSGQQVSGRVYYNIDPI